MWVGLTPAGQPGTPAKRRLDTCWEPGSIHSTPMKTSLLIVLASLSAACSGAPFTVAEMADMAQSPDAGGHLAEPDTAELPDAGPAGQPDAGPATGQPDAGPAMGQPDANPAQAVLVAVDAATVAPEASTVTPEASTVTPDGGTVQPEPDAGNAEPDAAAETPDAAAVVPEATAPPAPTCQPGTLDGPFVELTMAPLELDFGQVSVGGSRVLSSTLTNTGTCRATITASGGAIQNDSYSVLSSCGAGKVLEPGGTCTVSVIFSPVHGGEEDGVSAWTFGGQGYNIVVTGVGVQ